GYPPHQVGGTETYVLGLVEALKARSFEACVTCLETFSEDDGPDTRITTEEYLGTKVYRVWINTARHRMEHVIFDPKLIAILVEEFRKVVHQIEPDIIHVHPLQLGIESYLIETFNHENRNVVLTYHSSTTGCARGDLVYMGEEVCDARMDGERCTRCMLH